MATKATTKRASTKKQSSTTQAAKPGIISKSGQTGDINESGASATQSESQQPLTVTGVDTAQLVSLLDTWVGESKGFWNNKEYNLETASKENEKLYLGRQVPSSEEDPDASLDNRIFSSIRTIVPYVTARVTKPEVYPSSSSPQSLKFAEDFEKALYIKADKERVRIKAKYAIEDALIRRRGYLKLRYDPARNNFCSVEYVPAESIIIDHRAAAGEEPRYFRHTLDSTIDNLLVMFPEAESKINDIFNLNDTTPITKYHEPQKVHEDWVFWRVDGEIDLLVTWSVDGKAIACIKDPNWRYDDENFLDSHMIPLIEFSVLGDGRKHIDKTSYVEQAKYLQQNVDKRAKQINKGAGLGSVGMPVVDAEALEEDQGQYLTFDEDTVLELSVPDGKNINDVFTKWQASPLPGFIFDDKLDNRNAVDNAFGTSSITRGEGSDNQTLGQDVLLRDQSQGRQQDILDALDTSMQRLYLLMAQFMLVYGDEQELFRYVGEDSQFDYIIMTSDDLDTNAEIRVKSGSSMPIDKAQRRATANAAAQMQMVDPLTYWEIMDEPNAQKYAKRLMDYTSNPQSFLQDVNETPFNRDAFTDIELIKQGKQPPYRDFLEKEYFDYLTRFVTSGALDNPQIDPNTHQALIQFFNVQNQRATHQLGLAETQLPTQDDVNQYNQQADEHNQAMAGAMGNGQGSAPAPSQGASGQPGLPGQPGLAGQPDAQQNPAGMSPPSTPVVPPQK